MKSHNGMRPQDIVILLKVILMGRKGWQYRDLAGWLHVSISEISESLARSYVAGLVDESKRLVVRQSLMEFIQYGLQYVFPQRPGTMVTGVPTAHSQSFFKGRFPSEVDYVWPDQEGEMRGLAIIPLYKGAPLAVGEDEELHKVLAAIDILRVGRAREIKVALEELRKRILL